MELGGTWATLAESDAFLDQMLASGRAQVRCAGFTAEQAPLWLVTISATGEAQLSDTDLFIIGSQHGFEESGREAALRFARDLAYAESAPDIVVTLLPTANPWGAENNSRYNSAGTDINRTHINLESEEARAIERTFTVTNPGLSLDLHEWGNASAKVNVKGYEGQAPPMLRAWADGVVEDLTATLSLSVAVYPPTGHEGSVTPSTSSRGQPSFLVEVQSNDPPADRVSYQMATIQWFYNYAVANLSTLTTVKDQSRAWLTREGFITNIPLYNVGDAGDLTAPAGYVVSFAEPGVVQALNTFGITYHPTSSDQTHIYVPLDHYRRQTICWLLDPRAPHPIAANAEPVFLSDAPPVNLMSGDPGIYGMGPSWMTPAGRARRVVSEDGMIWGY